MPKACLDWDSRPESTPPQIPTANGRLTAALANAGRSRAESDERPATLSACFRLRISRQTFEAKLADGRFSVRSRILCSRSSRSRLFITSHLDAFSENNPQQVSPTHD